jgi:TPR repeat protein
MYANGRGVSKDETEAVRWYRKSAEQGNTQAIANLEVMNAHGRGAHSPQSESTTNSPTAAQSNITLPPVNPVGVSQPTIDEQYHLYLEQKCRGNIICAEKVRWELCDGKWDESPSPSMSICRISRSNYQ